MTARPCARYRGTTTVAAAPVPAVVISDSTCHFPPPHASVPAAVRAATNTRVRLLALDVLRERGEMYSTELAEALGCSVARAKSLLIGLELRGVVCSEHRETTVSGHGRRYYRVREEAASAGGMR